MERSNTNIKSILKKGISPFYYLPYHIEIARKKKDGDIFLPKEESVKSISESHLKKCVGVVSSPRMLKKVKKDYEMHWLNKYIKEWITVDKINSDDKKNFYIFLEVFAYPEMTRKIHKMGMQDGIDFMLLFDGEKYRKMYQGESKQRKWRDVEHLRKLSKEPWVERIIKMKDLIGNRNTSVLDLGCWECELEGYLPPHMRYYGCDYVKRREDTIVCNLNNYEFPTLVFDVAYISGSLEYMEHLEWYFDHICRAENEVVMSYSSLEYFPLIYRRKMKSWENHLTTMEIIKYMNERKFVLAQSDFWGRWTVILKFERKKNVI